MKQFFIVMAIFAMLVPVASLGDDFYESQLNRGIRNSDSYAYLLIRQADKNSTEAVNLLNQALSYSPDLPPVHFALARKSFSFSVSGMLQSIDYLVNAFNAYARNFWWSFTLAGALFFSLVLSFVLAFAVVIAVRLPLDIPLITHDLSESPARVFSLIILVLLSVLSPLCLIAGVLVLIGIYMSRADRNAVYGFLLFLIFLPMFLSAASMYISAPSSGAIKAVVQTNELKGNEYAIANLGKSTQDNERFSYALALKREGFFREAIAIYTQLAEKKQDARVLVNLGNCYVGLYNFQEENKSSLGEALKYYSSAIAIKPVASAYYNLSQISREQLEFEKGDEYFKAALNSDRVAVTRYRTVSGRKSNRFVADETLTSSELWGYARANSKKMFTFGLSILPPATISLIAVVLLFVFVLLPGRLRHTAYRCRKCSTILCNRCERNLVVGQICSQCYGSLLKLAELDVKERVARILSIYDQQKKRRDIMKILSFVLPGSSHIYAGRILLGLLILWPFLFCAMFPFISAFFFPGSSLISHGVVSLMMVLLALVIYGISNIFTRRGIATGWL
ncbi:MAG: tetratricopeptide repeat-containing protein [Thermodesulfovibrionales bacterium]